MTMRTTPEPDETEGTTQELARARDSFDAEAAQTRAHAAAPHATSAARDPQRIPVAPSRPAADEETRRATIAFIADAAEHDEGEDLHPARLDTPANDLELALANSALKKNTEREGGEGQGAEDV